MAAEEPRYYRVVTDIKVTGPVSEQTIKRLGAETAMLLKWATQRERQGQITVDLNHRGVRPLAPQAWSAPAPSPPS